MRTALLAVALFVLLLGSVVACGSGTPRTTPEAGAVARAEATADAGFTTTAAPPSAIVSAALAVAEERAIGPYELPFGKDRTVYMVAARSTKAPARLLANLHGVCNPPGYACGYWTEAAASTGFLVCPSGNSRCGAGGPPTWTESFTQIDADLETSIALVDARYPGAFGREGSVLTGFSLGATAAYQIALAHPGRWPYLVLVEADVSLDKAQLEKAGIRAVALVAGERTTAARLEKQGFRAKLWVMKGAGPHYSADIDAIMAEALAFVLSE